MRLIVCILFLATWAFAQVSAIVSGTVTDQTGALVGGAHVTAKSNDTGAERGVVTDSEGYYQLYSLPIGQYEIRGAKAGFTEQKNHRRSVGGAASHSRPESPGGRIERTGHR